MFAVNVFYGKKNILGIKSDSVKPHKIGTFYEHFQISDLNLSPSGLTCQLNNVDFGK